MSIILTGRVINLMLIIFNIKKIDKYNISSKMNVLKINIKCLALRGYLQR